MADTNSDLVLKCLVLVYKYLLKHLRSLFPENNHIKISLDKVYT